LETFVETKTKSMQMVEMVKGIGALQHKCGSQARMVEAFKGLRAKGDVEENAMLKKYVIAKEAWFAVNEWSNKCK
jgi:hypothetical protein